MPSSNKAQKSFVNALMYLKPMEEQGEVQTITDNLFNGHLVWILWLEGAARQSDAVNTLA